jgi:hypothetical protein
MLLSLEEAAKRADLTLEELQQNIQEGRLATVANTGDEDTAQVDEKNLEHFINKRSFNALWSDAETTADTNQANAPAKPNGSLRRVLTIEAVADLKIQNRILTARVDTLERLFSEFIEREKDAESTLLLNDDWKIDGLAGLAPQEAGVEEDLPQEDVKSVATAQVQDKAEAVENSPEAAVEAKDRRRNKQKMPKKRSKQLRRPFNRLRKLQNPNLQNLLGGAVLQT